MMLLHTGDCQMVRKILEIEINEDTPQDELELCVITAARTSDANIQRQASKAKAELTRREREFEMSMFNAKSIERVKAQQFQAAQAENADPAVPSGRKVFVVHGHDEEAKLAVARFLEKIDLEPIILHEQTDEGRTVIEKFSDQAGEVSYAVVLLTPDDIGGPASETDNSKLRHRARQNVIMELGFFLAKLGRANVCALVRGDIEIPSDYSGVIYKTYDNSGAWQLALAKEIIAAGIDIDMSLI